MGQRCTREGAVLPTILGVVILIFLGPHFLVAVFFLTLIVGVGGALLGAFQLPR